MQIIAVGVVLLAAMLLLRAWRWGWSGLAGVLLLAVALAYSAWRLVPYQPVYGVDMADAGQCPADARLSVLVANVLQKNDRREAVLGVLMAERADVVVLLEVDRGWLDALGPLVARYPHRVLEPARQHLWHGGAVAPAADGRSHLVQFRHRNPARHRRLADGGRPGRAAVGNPPASATPDAGHRRPRRGAGADGAAGARGRRTGDRRGRSERRAVVAHHNLAEGRERHGRPRASGARRCRPSAPIGRPCCAGRWTTCSPPATSHWWTCGVPAAPGPTTCPTG